MRESNIPGGEEQLEASDSLERHEDIIALMDLVIESHFLRQRAVASSQSGTLVVNFLMYVHAWRTWILRVARTTSIYSQTNLTALSTNG